MTNEPPFDKGIIDAICINCSKRFNSMRVVIMHLKNWHMPNGKRKKRNYKIPTHDLKHLYDFTNAPILLSTVENIDIFKVS
jgi:hypothetical protein